MKHIFEHWQEAKSGRTGYTVAEIVFVADAEVYENENDDWGDFLSSWTSQEYKTLNPAKKAAEKFYLANKKGHFISMSIDAKATLTEYYDDDNSVKFVSDDWARLGTIDENGKYVDMCERADWLEKE